MCGIAGIFLAPNASDPRTLGAIGAMTDALRHRGPDGQGFWADRGAGIAFGHRRLAIVDLSETGRQPMRSQSGRFVIAFNGEIYNFRDLRRDLEASGHRFRGTSDTEVLLGGIEKWGLEATLSRAAGMFAIALWDAHTRTLHLTRDRLGKKPLYVGRTRDALLFASELKGLSAYPGFGPDIDLDAASAMLANGWVPDDRCIWQDVFKVPPGSLLSISAADIAYAPDARALLRRSRTWWSLAAVAEEGQRNPVPGRDEDLVAELDGLLQISVRERMIADVPLGAFLSGGVDSSAVVALMQKQSPTPVRTFTIAFGEDGFDESAHAAAIARHLGTDHTELRLTPSAAREVIPELPRIWDEPFADESQIPTLLISRLARQHVTVALTGDGGDECFAGYSRHFAAARLLKLLRLPLLMRQGLSSVLDLVGRAARYESFGYLPLSGHARHALRSDRLRRLADLVSAANEEDMYRRLVGGSAESTAGGTLPPSGPPASSDPVARLQFDDLTHYLPGDILVKLDRASMADGLEGRCPILDHRVVEFAWRLPTHAKVRNGRGKWILRELLHRYVPPAMVDRPKQGFDVPIGSWLKGPLRTWASDLLQDACREHEGVLNPQAIQANWRDHLSGRQDHTRDLWPVLMFQAWREHGRKHRLSAAETPSVQSALTGS